MHEIVHEKLNKEHIFTLKPIFSLKNTIKMLKIWQFLFFGPSQGFFFQATAPKLVQTHIFWVYWAKKRVASSFRYGDHFSYSLSTMRRLTSCGPFNISLTVYDRLAPLRAWGCFPTPSSTDLKVTLKNKRCGYHWSFAILGYWIISFDIILSRNQIH